MRTVVTPAGVALLLFAMAAAAQQPPPDRPSTDLAAVPVASAAEAHELTIRWRPYPGDAPIAAGAAPPAADFALLQRRAVTGPLPRQRNPQLSEDQLVAIAVDAAGRESDWQLIKDPRVLRAEFPDDTGRLSGQVMHRTEAEFLLTLPALGTYTEVRMYQPVWTGTEFRLRFLGSIPLTPQ
jgi:hypothetical protein